MPGQRALFKRKIPSDVLQPRYTGKHWRCVLVAVNSAGSSELWKEMDRELELQLLPRYFAMFFHFVLIHNPFERE